MPHSLALQVKEQAEAGLDCVRLVLASDEERGSRRTRYVVETGEAG
ncbi:hypothetical protein [Streptomyces sp. NPDC058548]